MCPMLPHCLLTEPIYHPPSSSSLINPFLTLDLRKHSAVVFMPATQVVLGHTAYPHSTC